ncbi:MAG: hypothetical protein Q4C05_04060 [Akkermansia sp.]|nr:hypothetical protein [Akkermansia sp.]
MKKCIVYLWMGMMMLGMAVGEVVFPERFMKYEKIAQDEYQLSTPILSYEGKEGNVVELVGAVHVAEKEYYARLNKLFATYQLLFFEMVGGECLQRVAYLEKKIDRSKPLWGLTLEEAREWNQLQRMGEIVKKQNEAGLIKYIGGMYKKMAQALNIASQTEAVDYSPAHFVHADMSHSEFVEAQEQANETMSSIALNEMWRNMKDPEAYKGNDMKLLSDFITGNMTGLKNELMKILASSSKNTMENTVILEGRNKKCFEIFDQVMSENNAPRVGIFYGAAHLPGMHKEMQKRGYRLTQVRWEVAWSTVKSKDK